MKTLKKIHQHIEATKSLKKISEMLKKEFPYTDVNYRTTIYPDGFYKIFLDYIKSNDVDKYIARVEELSHKHGFGSGIPIMIRYNEIKY